MTAQNYPSIKSAVVYTTAPWDHALAVLRFVAPLQKAGIVPIQGNKGGMTDLEKVSQADLVLIQRDFPSHLQDYDQILSTARAQSKPIVYDLDDWLLELPENHPDRVNHHYAGNLFPILRAIMEADAVTVSTTRLAERIHSLNKNILVLPNYIDEGLWNLPPRQTMVDPQMPLSIVYMGGDSHIPDFEPLVPMLLEILQTYGEGIVYKSIGMQPVPALRALPNVEFIPFQFTYSAYAEYVQKQHYDIAIAPLANNIFNLCKSSIKYLEYSALGIPGVFSRITPYAGLITNSLNGFVASDIHEWRQAIIRLIENVQLRVEIGAAAQEGVRQQWLLGDHAWQWLQAYQQAAANTGQKTANVTLPITLLADLTRQSRQWEQEIVSRLIDNKPLTTSEQVVDGPGEKISGFPYNSPVPVGDGLVGTISRGLKWFSSYVRPKQK